MSASTRTAPAQIGFGRFPSALAALALVVILAVAVTVMALNVKTAPATGTGAKGAPPPAFIDHGSRDEFLLAVPAVPFIDHGSRDEIGKQTAPVLSGGGWGPAAAAGLQQGTAPVYKGDNSRDDQYLIQGRNGAGNNGPQLRAQ